MNQEMISNYLADFREICPKVCANQTVADQYKTPLKVISRYFPDAQNDKKVLDWGMGIGHFSHLLMSFGFDVSGYSYTQEDLNPTVDLLKRRFSKELRVTQPDMTDPVGLPYEDARFDAVFSVGVLEHVRETGGNEEASLQELKRILKPGGKLFIFHFPNRYSWIEATTRFIKRNFDSQKHAHIYLYRHKDIKQLALASGFKRLESGLYNLFPRMTFGVVPDRVANHALFKASVNLAESLSSLIFKQLSQNYYAVFEKPN